MSTTDSLAPTAARPDARIPLPFVPAVWLAVLVWLGMLGMLGLPHALPFDPSPLVRGHAVALALALFVRPFVDLASLGWSSPLDDALEDARPPVAPLLVGMLEASVLFAACAFQAWAVVAAYLVLKGAAKWAAWQHLVALPREPEALGLADASALEALRARHTFASKQATRFVVGSLGFLGAGLAGALTV